MSSRISFPCPVVRRDISGERRRHAVLVVFFGSVSGSWESDN
jgi:hypothetical protein